MDSTRIHEVFNTIGKLLNLSSNVGVPYASGVREAVAAIEHQNSAAANAVDPYSELQQVVFPLLNSLRSVVSGIDRLPTIAKSGIDSYIRTIGATELGQPANTPAATVCASLVQAMTSAGDSVTFRGVIDNWFGQNYSVQLPTHNPPTISDDIITVDFVEGETE